jgi:hypothetical protein
MSNNPGGSLTKRSSNSLKMLTEAVFREVLRPNIIILSHIWSSQGRQENGGSEHLWNLSLLQSWLKVEVHLSQIVPLFCKNLFRHIFRILKLSIMYNKMEIPQIKLRWQIQLESIITQIKHIRLLSLRLIKLKKIINNFWVPLLRLSTNYHQNSWVASILSSKPQVS